MAGTGGRDGNRFAAWVRPALITGHSDPRVSSSIRFWSLIANAVAQTLVGTRDARGSGLEDHREPIGPRFLDTISDGSRRRVCGCGGATDPAAFCGLALPAGACFPLSGAALRDLGCGDVRAPRHGTVVVGDGRSSDRCHDGVGDRPLCARLALRRRLCRSGPGEDNFGIAVFSRLPLAEAGVHTLGEAGLPSLSMRVDVGGVELTLLATHPTPPIPARRFHLRNDQLARLGELIDSSSRPLVLVGDLNMTMWSPWYRRLTGTRRLFNSRRGFGVQGSWPACLPEFLRLPIDHCLLSDGLSVAGCSLGPDIGSDHLPLLVDLLVYGSEDR